MSLWSLVPRAIRERLVLGKIRKGLLERLLGLGLPKAVAERMTEDIMGNWQTWAAGIAGIAGGVALIANECATKAFRMDEIFKGIAAIGAGLTVISHGNKQEATRQAIEANTRAVVQAGEATARATRDLASRQIVIDGQAIASTASSAAARK